MVYIKYKCVVCGIYVEEIFDFSTQFDKVASNPDAQLCEMHRF